MTDESSVPPITPALREAARKNAGRWLYVIDPFFDPDGEVPPYGIEGAWKVDDAGELTGEFKPNPRYRPSPYAAGLPPPTDPLDEALHLGATGYGTNDDVARILLDRELLIGAGPQDAFPMNPESRSVLVFTDERHLPEKLPPGLQGWQRIVGRDLVSALPGDVKIIVNPASKVKVAIPCDGLQGMLRDMQ